MATIVQTRAQVESEIQAAVAFLHEIRKAAGLTDASPTTNIIARLETLIGNAPGSFSNQSHAEAFRIRNLIAQASSRDRARALLAPLLRNYAKVIGTIPETNTRDILSRIRKDFIDNSRRVKSRNISHGSPSSGSNIGDGAINRLTVDEDGFDLENVHVEAKRADCVQDEHTGADEHAETFEVTGQDAELDQINPSGSGVIGELTAADARESGRFISNPSFSQFSGSGATLDFTDWTFNDVTNVQADTTNTYRDFVGDDTPTSLRIDADEYVRQNLNVLGSTFDLDIPVYAQLAYNRSVGSADGTLQFRLGSRIVSVDLSGASAGWNILRLPINKYNWPRQFLDVEDPVVAVILTGRSTGYVLVDDIIVVNYDRIDGTWYKAVGGATPFLIDDSFTWSDTLNGAEGLINFYLWLAFGQDEDPSLPGVTDGSEDFADPTV